MQKAPLSVRIIHFFSSFLFWILIVGTSLLFVYNLLLQFDLVSGNIDVSTTLPLEFDVREVGTLDLWSETSKVKIIEATGKMQVLDPPKSYMKMIARGLFLVMMVTLFMAWRFKLFISNIKAGVIFDVANINNLKQIAYGLVVTFFLKRAYEVILYFMVNKSVEFSSIIPQGIKQDESAFLLSALLLWVLAHIFMKGVEMKEDQELTI